MRQCVRRTILFLAMVFSLAGFQNCSRPFSSSEVDPEQKAAIVKNTQLENEEEEDSVSEGDSLTIIDQPMVTSGETPLPRDLYPEKEDEPSDPTPPGAGRPIVDGGEPLWIPVLNAFVNYTCATNETNRVGYNLKTITDPVYSVVDRNTREVLCSGDASSIVADIHQSKSFSLDLCAAIENSDITTMRYYTFILHDKSKPFTQFESPATQGVASINITLPAGKLGANVQGSVLYDTNTLNLDPTFVNDTSCDRISSPLVINFGKMPIRLSSLFKGVFFDILGENSTPRAHVKRKISWIKSPQVMFLTKPNSDGQVNGINELFGDNTRGPDGQFAANGFAALAKHDSDRNGFITMGDEIFGHLRMWSDTNLDGLAVADELFTLDEMDIEAIDLSYDPNYKERDRHGNMILYKSIVKTHGDEYYPMFDIWFRHD